MDEKTKQSLREYRDRLQDLEKSIVEQQDKAILWFSGAGLALSINIAVILKSPLVWLWLLKAAWLFFCVAIAATLLSFRATEIAVEKQISATDDAITNGSPLSDPDNTWRTWFNRISLAAVFCGIVCSVIFLSLQKFGETQ